MSEYNAGEARLRIVPDASGFKRKLEADLRRIQAEYAVRVTANTSQAARELEAFRARESANAVNLKVDVDTAGATAKLAALKAVTDGLGGGSGVLSALKFPAIFAGIGELPAITLAITNVAGALQQLSGAGLAVPGVLGGVLASVGTVKLGISGVSDAYKALDKAADGSAKNVEAANKALEKLAPSARDAVTTAHDLVAQLNDALGKPIQQNLFAGISDDLKTLYAQDLPVLQRGLGGISTSLNGLLRQVLQSAGSDSSKGLLDRILGNTGDAEARLKKAIDPLITGVGTLVAAGSDVLPRLADDIGRASEKFSKFITEADKNGTLDKFINDGITGLEQLGGAGVNVVKILNDITTAAGGDGGLLKSLDEGSQKLHEFLSSAEGQNKLREWFAEGKKELGDLVDLLKQAPGFFRGIYDAGKKIADTIVPPLRDISHFLGEHPGLVKAAAEAYVVWKSIDGVTSLFNNLTKIGNLLDGLPGRARRSGSGIGGALEDAVDNGSVGGTNGGGGRRGERGVKGGGGFGDALRGLAAVGGLTLAFDGYTEQSGDNSPDLGGAFKTVGGGALAGGGLGGPWGAVAGALIGAASQMVLIFQQGIDSHKSQQDLEYDNKFRNGEQDRIDAANLAQGKGPEFFHPALKSPSIREALLPRIRAGQVPGFKVGANGEIISTATGEAVPVGDLTQLPPAPPPPPAPPAPKQPVGFPLPPTGAPLIGTATTAAPPVQGPPPVADKPLIGSAAQNSIAVTQEGIDKIASSINSLPEGNVRIKDATPQTIENLNKLDVRIDQVSQNEIEVKANTEEAQKKLDSLIRDYKSRVISLQINPTMAPQTLQPGLFQPPKAQGGVLPGYSPGVDNMLVPMSGGEGVLIPEAVRALGPGFVYGINSMFRGGISRRGYSVGGIVDQYGNPVTPGLLPGPTALLGPGTVAPNPYGGGGIGSIFGSIASGIQGPIGNLLSLGSGLLGSQGQGGPAGSIADRAATIPGLWGLIGSLNSSNPAENLQNWGVSTAQWLGNFAAKTLTGFGTALWKGALGFFGLENSILSPDNPWFQAAAQAAGFELGSDGPFGKLLGNGSSGTLDPKKMREAMDRIADKDNAVAVAQARLNELPADAKGSTRLAAQNALDKANREAAEARADLQTLQQGGTLSGNAYDSLTGAPSGLSSTQASVYQAMLSAGFPPSEWSALKNIIDHESSWNPGARNPSSGAFGLFQFLGHQGDKYGQLGGYSGDPAQQAVAGMAYIKDRYGSPSAAWAYWQAHGNYAGGGAAHGPGGPKGDEIPALLSDNEHVLTSEDVNAMGGQDAVYAFRRALHRAAGGSVMLGMVPADPSLLPGGGQGTRRRITWWGGKNGVPHTPDMPQDILPIPGRPGQAPPNIFGGTPGEWPPNGNFPKPGDPRWIWRHNRRGVGGLGFAEGGRVSYLQMLARARNISASAVNPPSPPPGGFAQVPDAHLKQLPAQVAPAGPPAPAPPVAAPSEPAPPAAPAGPVLPPASVAPSAGRTNHNLPAVNTAIQSGAATLGNIASTAASLGLGAAGAGPLGSIAGSLIGGLFQEGGKIVQGIANVGSSFLIGNVTGGTTPEAYGRTLRPAQNVPVTAPSRTQFNTFNGMDVPKVFQELDLRDALDHQATLAHRPARVG